MLFVGVLIIWVVACSCAADNLGIEIGPLVAGLGIGGIAVALAVQNVLGDLFASLSIALDKPFGVGDSLVIDDDNGTVEHIGVKSTRLRAASGEQIIISNADLLKSRVRNYGRMHRAARGCSSRWRTRRRRALIARGAEDHRGGRRGAAERALRPPPLRALRRLRAAFEVIYFVHRAERYVVFMDAQQAINLALLDEFARRGSECSPIPRTRVSLSRQSAARRPEALRLTAFLAAAARRREPVELADRAPCRQSRAGSPRCRR